MPAGGWGVPPRCGPLPPLSTVIFTTTIITTTTTAAFATTAMAGMMKNLRRKLSSFSSRSRSGHGRGDHDADDSGKGRGGGGGGVSGVGDKGCGHADSSDADAVSRGWSSDLSAGRSSHLRTPSSDENPQLERVGSTDSWRGFVTRLFSANGSQSRSSCRYESDPDAVAVLRETHSLPTSSASGSLWVTPARKASVRRYGDSRMIGRGSFRSDGNPRRHGTHAVPLALPVRGSNSSMESEEEVVAESAWRYRPRGLQSGDALVALACTCVLPQLPVSRFAPAPADVATTISTTGQDDPPTRLSTTLTPTPDFTAGAGARGSARYGCYRTDWPGAPRASYDDGGGHERIRLCRKDHVCGLAPVSLDEDGQLLPLYTPPSPPPMASMQRVALPVTAVLAETSAARGATAAAVTMAATNAATITTTPTGRKSDRRRQEASGSDGSGSSRGSRDRSGRGVPEAARAEKGGPRRPRCATPPPSLPPSPGGHMDTSAGWSDFRAGAAAVDANGGGFPAVTDGCALVDDGVDEAAEEGHERSVVGLSSAT